MKEHCQVKLNNGPLTNSLWASPPDMDSLWAGAAANPADQIVADLVQLLVLLGLLLDGALQRRDPHVGLAAQSNQPCNLALLKGATYAWFSDAKSKGKKIGVY